MKNDTIKIYTLIFFALIIALLFFFIGMHKWMINNSGEYGNLLSGTFGVVASVGALIAVIATLREQQKVNNQKDIIEAFTYEYKKFKSLTEDKNSKNELNTLWNEDNNGLLQQQIDKITYDLSNETYDIINQLKTLCKNDNLKNLGRCLNRMLSLKQKAKDLNSEVGRGIELDWDTIPEKWKSCVGCYLAWNTIDITTSTAEKNEIIKSFARKNEYKYRLSRYVPMFRIEEKELKKGEKENWDSFAILIDSNNNFELQVPQIDIYFDGERPKLIPSYPNIKLPPDTKESFTLETLFGEEKNKLIRQIEEKVQIATAVIMYIDIHLVYLNCCDYIYQGQLEFNIYPKEDADKRKGLISK